MNECFFFLQIFILMTSAVSAFLYSSHALSAFIILSGILANIFVVKQINLFGLDVTASDAYMVAGMVGLNLMQEYYGKKAARRTITLSLAGFGLYLILSSLHLCFTPSVHDRAHEHFYAILNPMPRIIAASFFAYFCSQKFDYYFYGLLRYLFSGRLLTIRASISLCVSQTLDTVLFSVCGLYGIVASLQHVMFFSLVLKALVIGCSIPCIMVAQFLIKRLAQFQFFAARLEIMEYVKKETHLERYMNFNNDQQ